MFDLVEKGRLDEMITQPAAVGLTGNVNEA